MKVTYDTEYVNSLEQLSKSRNLPAGTLGERKKKLDHGTMVPLHFVNQYDTEYRLAETAGQYLKYVYWGNVS